MLMLEILLIGLNHTTAPVALRECLAFSEDETINGLESLRRFETIHEAMLISTCNRVEILLTTDHPEQAISDVKRFFTDQKQAPADQFESCLYMHAGDEAVRHIFRVAASLNSMVVGEPQILGQIKEAYQKSIRMKMVSVLLNRLMHRAFFVAKRVRTETGIGDNAVSISYAAVELARKIFGSLEERCALLIGAGEMAELAIENLLRHKVTQVKVANRTFESGVKLARRFQGQAIRFDEIASSLSQVDIIISSTGAPGYVLEKSLVKSAMRQRRHRPLFLIDIAVPRDIDPKINRIENAYLYDIDDLQGVVDRNVADRSTEALKGERIIDESVVLFRRWAESLQVVPTIVALRRKLEGIARHEMKRTLQGLTANSEALEPALTRMTDAMISKIMHHPTMMLKKDDFHGDKSVYLDAARKLFSLDTKTQPPSSTQNGTDPNHPKRRTS